MDKLFSISQFLIAILMLLCVLVEVVAHSIMGHITSIIGYVVAFIFIFLMWKLVHLSWKELREENKK
ncbi:MAG: hypothetical protein RSA66_08570 [Muribaculaceae bacterium]